MSTTTKTTEPSRTDFAALRWDAAWIDPAIRRMAETAAQQAGLSVGDWTERAIRKACRMPGAPHLGPSAAAQPATPAARGFAAMLTGAQIEPPAIAEAAVAAELLAPEEVSAAQQQTTAVESRLFAERDAERATVRERIAAPAPTRIRRSRPPVAERGGNRVISMIGSAGIAAVLAIIAVAILREGGSPAKREQASNESSAQTVSNLPPVSSLDREPLRVSRNATDRNMTFAAVPPSPAAASNEPAGDDSAGTPGDDTAGNASPAATAAAPTQAAAPVPTPPAPTQAQAKPVQMAALPNQATTNPSSANDEARKPSTSSSAGAIAAPVAASTTAPAAKEAAASPTQPSAAPAADQTQTAMAATTAAPEAAPPPAPQVQSDIKLAASLVPLVKAGDHVAEYRLGILYALGKGVPHDYNQAATLLRRSALSGLAEAEYDYGVLCDKGLGVPRDSAEAARWYAKAAQQGHPPAALNLGYAYAEGLGVTRNLPDAAHWFRRAAEAGLVNAQFNLAYMFEQGAGVSKSVVDAYAWYSLAAEKGDQGAEEALQRVEAKMSMRELTAAKGRVRTIKRSIRAQS
jgi:TPR repeat protein